MDGFIHTKQLLNLLCKVYFLDLRLSCLLSDKLVDKVSAIRISGYRANIYYILLFQAASII